MKRKTILLISAMLLVALATVGVGYGLWFEVLKIHGTVNTSELDVGFSPAYTYEWFSNGNYEPIAAPAFLTTDVPDDYYQYLPEEIGPAGINTGLFDVKYEYIRCRARRILDQDPALNNPSDQRGKNVLEITVDGAYPSYTCRVVFDIVNLGRVPVHLSDWWIEGGDGDAWWVKEPECVPHKLVSIDHDGYFMDTDVIQLHKGETAVCTVDMHFDNYTGFLVDAEKGAAFRLKDFGHDSTGEWHIYLGDGDLGSGDREQLCQGSNCWVQNTPYDIVWDVDPIGETLDVGNHHLESILPRSGCAPEEYNALYIFGRVKEGELVVNDLMIDGLPVILPDLGTNSFTVVPGSAVEWMVPGASDDFTLTAEMILNGAAGKNENSKLEIGTRCVSHQVLQENASYTFHFGLVAEQWNESGTYGQP